MQKEVYFNFPQAWVLFLLIIPILSGLLYLNRYRSNRLHSYAALPSLTRLLIPRSTLYTLTKIGGWLLIWTLVTIAMLEPFGNVRYSSSPARSPDEKTDAKPHYTPHQIVFLVDTSASMRVPDTADGNPRLEEAKSIMEDIMRQLNGQTVSLYAFTSELSSLVPPTLDYLFSRLLIKDLQIDEGDVGGTLFETALKSLREQAFPKPSDQRYSVVMLSDGGDNKLEELKGEERIQEKEKILNTLSHAETLQLRLFTIGLGSKKGEEIPHVTADGKPVLSKLETGILQELAEKGRGKYYQASSRTSWRLAQELKREWGEDPLIYLQRPSSEREVSTPNPEEVIVDWYFQIPLGLALLFYLINLLLPDTRKA